MPKYYEGEAIVKAFTETTNQSATWARGVLASMKEADVAPVVHGHWIVTDNRVNGKTADCSVCGAHFVYFKGHLQMDKMPGCPKCLSKMDEEVDKND